MDQTTAKREYGGSLANLYRRYVRKRIKKDIHRQRLKLVYDAWWYLPLLRFRKLGITERINLVWKLIRIDWFILHANKPAELAPILVELMSRCARPNEVFVEAGCWNGGSTAKFSLVCKLYGYKLHVFDSFQGVKEWDFAYAAKELDVQQNIKKYGELDVCKFHPGWFKDTLWRQPVTFPVCGAYIDCDVPQGTLEVLSGILPTLVEDGFIYTQDYHLEDVKKVLNDPKTWTEFGVPAPFLKPVIRNIARLTWSKEHSVTRR